jgi:hypothetical protein
METKQAQLKVGFWKTSKEKFFVSHNKGLNQEQVDLLHRVKVGDRLKLWQNEDSEDNKSNFTLGVMVETGVDR